MPKRIGDRRRGCNLPSEGLTLPGGGTITKEQFYGKETKTTIIKGVDRVSVKTKLLEYLEKHGEIVGLSHRQIAERITPDKHFSGISLAFKQLEEDGIVGSRVNSGMDSVRDYFLVKESITKQMAAEAEECREESGKVKGGPMLEEDRIPEKIETTAITEATKLPFPLPPNVSPEAPGLTLVEQMFAFIEMLLDENENLQKQLSGLDPGRFETLVLRYEEGKGE